MVLQLGAGGGAGGVGEGRLEAAVGVGGGGDGVALGAEDDHGGGGGGEWVRCRWAGRGRFAFRRTTGRSGRGGRGTDKWVGRELVAFIMLRVTFLFLLVFGVFRFEVPATSALPLPSTMIALNSSDGMAMLYVGGEVEGKGRVLDVRARLWGEGCCASGGRLGGWHSAAVYVRRSPRR